ncbi:MAG: RNA-guided endonuclease InsQ/TnpB family protein [Pseudonocardiaceae bacterium]
MPGVGRDPRLPVRTRPDRRPSRDVPVALRGAALRLQLRARAGAGGPGSAGRRAQLRHHRRSAHPGGVLHKLTTRLVREHGTIVIEDLHVAGMIRNRRLARHISGLGMAEFRQLAYKTRDKGVRLIVADRWYPSSKTCSACGAVKAKLTLTERQFVCESCGTRIDRDLNAAHNLAALAAQASEPSCGRTENEPAGNPRKTAIGGNGYRHGKAPPRSQGRLREVTAP